MDDEQIIQNFTPQATAEDCKRERRKARELKRSPWWRRLVSLGHCYYCEKHFSPDEITMDHKVPLIQGGISSKSNIVPCCKSCNTKKSNQLPVDWMLDEGVK